MMVGSRFSVGATIPASLPPDLHAEIRAIEATLTDDERKSLRWTLTWLESRPIVTLDNGTQIGVPGHTNDI
jgi:hypothetical protein